MNISVSETALLQSSSMCLPLVTQSLIHFGTQGMHRMVTVGGSSFGTTEAMKSIFVCFSLIVMAEKNHREEVISLGDRVELIDYLSFGVGLFYSSFILLNWSRGLYQPRNIV